MTHFSLVFAPHEDGEIFLIASLDTREFKGQCHYWCAPSTFENLAEALQTFPITKQQPLDMLWYVDCIELLIPPIDSVGHLSVKVALRDFGSDWNRCQSQFHTNYGGVDRFQEQLKKVLADGVGEAVLSAY